MDSLIGIDSGLTMTKVVVFDVSGTPLAVASRQVPQQIPRPHHIERDMPTLWSLTVDALKEALATCERPAGSVRAVAATAHGDGLFLLDRQGQPLGPGILSLDSRAGEVLKHWTDAGLADSLLMQSGQVPHVSAPATLLAWIQAHQPDRFGEIGHILSCKDWLRYCLTGTIGTDRTEASTSFTNVTTQDWSDDVLALYGLQALRPALPAISHSSDIVGTVTADAARLTGLPEGTPVAAGLHDVTASGLGIGGQRNGSLDVVAGTYSINQTLSTEPRRDGRWFCRNGIEVGTWNHMSISPASSANYEWFLQTLCAAEVEVARTRGTSVHEPISAEILDALTRPSTVFFHPYLYGSPYGDAASASFAGLHGWHTRGDVLRAVFEGIAFNHRYHINALQEGFTVNQIRLTGGVSRNPVFRQMFANAVGLPVSVQAIDEAAAWGAALCAGAAAGCYESVFHDPRDTESINSLCLPDHSAITHYDRRYALYTRLAKHQQAMWTDIERLSREESGRDVSG